VKKARPILFALALVLIAAIYSLTTHKPGTFRPDEEFALKTSARSTSRSTRRSPIWRWAPS
jgi:hypothetical protein